MGWEKTKKQKTIQWSILGIALHSGGAPPPVSFRNILRQKSYPCRLSWYGLTFLEPHRTGKVPYKKCASKKVAVRFFILDFFFPREGIPKSELLGIYIYITPFWGGFSRLDGLLDSEEGANTDRSVFGKLSARRFQRRTFGHQQCPNCGDIDNGKYVQGGAIRCDTPRHL